MATDEIQTLPNWETARKGIEHARQMQAVTFGSSEVYMVLASTGGYILTETRPSIRYMYFTIPADPNERVRANVFGDYFMPN